LFGSVRAKLQRPAAGAFAGVTVPRDFPLAQAGDGERVEIVAVHGGSNIHRRLSDLGLSPGKRITVVAGQLGGPILVAVGASRVAIGFGMALKVRVVPVVGEISPNEAV
jgi:ferrous iron transport protein A